MCLKGSEGDDEKEHGLKQHLTALKLNNTLTYTFYLKPSDLTKEEHLIYI